MKPPSLNLAPLKNKNGIVSDKLISKPVKKDLKASFDSVPVPANLTKVAINASARTCPDSKISWDVVSPTIRQLGKVFKLPNYYRFIHRRFYFYPFNIEWADPGWVVLDELEIKIS